MGDMKWRRPITDEFLKSPAYNVAMSLTIHIPKQAEDALREAFGEALDNEAKQALAIEAFRRGKLSLGQFARVLDIDTNQADGLLKSRGVAHTTTVAEFDDEFATLNKHLKK